MFPVQFESMKIKTEGKEVKEFFKLQNKEKLFIYEGN